MNETALMRLLHLYAAPAVPVAPGDGITGRQSVQRMARRRGQAERRRERAARGNA